MVTANLDFHPFFKPFGAQMDRKRPFSSFFCVAANRLYRKLLRQKTRVLAEKPHLADVA
jgi:hypothetical protein